ncbi:MAG: OmpA family protein, partial [Mariprofundaceae bacterium]|nr:OmpA family protein [Mariprofundaceae bacterium]
HRANFRLVDRAPEFTPVTVQHVLVEEEGVVWANVDVSQRGEVPLTSLQGFYTLPTGWRYIEGSATLDGIASVPEQSPFGLIWQLDAEKTTQRIRLAMRGGGESGMKEAVAYARFASSGTAKGRTELASINIQDTLKELRDQRSFTMQLKFATRQALLPEQELFKLNELVHSLGGLVIRELIVEGHTDNIPIAKRNRQEFADNMALSTARAIFVAEYLQEQLQLDDHVVMALGKGDIEPIASNVTGKGRKKNRRVVLKIRADKISHDFSSALKDKSAEASGKAEASWDEEEIAALPTFEVKTKGIISPADGMGLPSAIAAVRIVLDSSLKAELALDGEVIGEDRIGFKQEDENTGLTTYTYIGVDFGKPGKHVLSLKGLGPFGNARYEETISVVRTGELAKIKLVESAENIADGKTPVRFRLVLLDQTGVAINGGLELRQMGGDLSPIQQLHISPLLVENAQAIRVDAEGWVTMAAVNQSGMHHVSLAYNKVQENIEIYVKPESREWIMVGFGEGTLGFNELSGAVQPITNADEQDAFYQDGRVAFYAKGKLKGDFLLTLAYDTLAKTETEKNSRFGDIDPSVMYTVYGDMSQQQFDAVSSEKLYLKIEKDTFYALFGDYNTGLNSTELSRYSRVFTGLKSEMHDDALGFTAFVTQTSQTMVRDDIQGNGTSGLYSLSRSNLMSNSETIRIETMDRFKSEVVLNTTTLTRHLDYDIDYLLGTVWFKQPVLSKDSNLNPIMIRVEYESDDLTDQFTTAGGRVYVQPSEDMEIGGTFITEGRLGGSNTLNGVDLKIQINQDVEIRAEAASTENGQVLGSAWKVESRLTSKDVSGLAYIRQQEDAFGLGQQPTSENATLKMGADGQWRLDQDNSINAEVFRQETTNTGAVRDMAHVQYNKQIEAYKMRAGVRANRDQDGAGSVTESTLGNVGATTQITNRLSARADHEQALSQNNGVDFPTRSSVGLDYRITAATSLSATQEWTQGQFQDTTSTRLGVNSQPWNGAQMSASYEQQLAEDGKRSFANAGLLQTWKINQALSVSASVDQTKVLTHKTPVQLNLNAPVATGGDDFTAYSLGADYRPGSWVWTNRVEYRISDLSTHRGGSVGLQGSPMDALAMQLSLRWQQDDLANGEQRVVSDASLRAAWRPSYDALMLLNRFDVRQNEHTGGTFESKSLRYINNMTANWQSTAAWQLRVNHGIKLSQETLAANSWSGLTDLLGVQWIYDFNEDWDVSVHTAALRVRHLNNYQPNAGLAVGHNMFDNFWLSMGYNFVGFYDADFAAAEYARKGVFMRFRFKFDQNSLEDMLKQN